CGAIYADAEVTCASRFAELLALDHSRREPWGSRHGLAFAAYTLQHPEGVPLERLERSWLALYRVYVAGDESPRVFDAMLHRPPIRLEDWNVPPLPPALDHVRYPVTLADLGDFAAATYATGLDRWCRAVVEAREQ